MKITNFKKSNRDKEIKKKKKKKCLKRLDFFPLTWGNKFIFLSVHRVKDLTQAVNAYTTRGQTTNRPLVCVCPDATLARSSVHSSWNGSNDLEIKSARHFNTKSLIWSIHFNIFTLLDKTHSGKASSFQWQADPPSPHPVAPAAVTKDLVLYT